MCSVVFGVGKVTAKKMHLKGIFRGKDLKKKSEIQLTRWFGKSGKYYYNIVRGIDNRVVNPNRIRKSLGAERTFENDISTKYLKTFKTSLESVKSLLVFPPMNRFPTLDGNTLGALLIYFHEDICGLRGKEAPFQYFMS